MSLWPQWLLKPTVANTEVFFCGCFCVLESPREVAHIPIICHSDHGCIHAGTHALHLPQGEQPILQTCMHMRPCQPLACFPLASPSCLPGLLMCVSANAGVQQHTHPECTVYSHGLVHTFVVSPMCTPKKFSTASWILRAPCSLHARETRLSHVPKYSTR